MIYVINFLIMVMETNIERIFKILTYQLIMLLCTMLNFARHLKDKLSLILPRTLTVIMTHSPWPPPHRVKHMEYVIVIIIPIILYFLPLLDSKKNMSPLKAYFYVKNKWFEVVLPVDKLKLNKILLVVFSVYTAFHIL